MANEKKLHSFFNHAGISICTLDSNSGQFIEFNDVAHENLGYSREEFEKLTIYDIDGSVNKGSISKRRKEEDLHVFGTLHRTKNGDFKNMLINYVPVQVDGKRMIQSIHIDVTAQKAVEMALKESEARYRAIIDLIPDGIIISDKGIILFANSTYGTMMGWPNIEDVIGKHVSDIVKYSPIDGKDSDKEEVDRQVNNNDPMRQIEACFLRPDGTKVFTEISSTRIEYKGKPVILGVFHDITREKEREEALISREKRSREILENSKDAILLTDFSGKIIEANQHACDSLGYTREELLSLSMYDIEVREEVLEENIEVLNQMVPGVPITKEGTHRRKDGTTFPVEVRATLYETGDRKLICSLARDITERKQAEERL